MATTQTTLVVSFGNESLSDGFYLAELDDQDNEARLGKTSGFAPGDAVSFIVQHGPSLAILGTPITTNGYISSDGIVSRTKESNLVYAAVDEEQSAPCLGSLSLGTPIFGNVTAFEDSSLVDSTTLKAISGSFPSVYNCSVTGQFTKFTLYPSIPTLAEDETYDVYIFIFFGAA